MSKTLKWENNGDIQIFREYLRIPSVHPNIDYEPCVEFIKRQAASLDLPVKIHYPVNEKNPLVVLTWEGSQPKLPSIVLNSHMDVVPVFEEHWTHPPFAAEMDSDGKIFGRGAQDMKNIAIQYLGAIRSLKRDGVKQLKRTVHVLFVPDEELAGELGMKKFVTTDEFKAMNVGFSLDEGEASPTETIDVFYGEKVNWKIEFICRGQGGHGSRLLENTPGDKIYYIINKFVKYRDGEKEKLKKDPKLNIGDVTTINLTVLRGGAQANVVPPQMSAVFDIRIANDVDLDQFEQMINQWCDEAGGDIEIKFLLKEQKVPITAIDNTNPFWIAFKNAIGDLNLKIQTKVDSGGTDSRFVRSQNIPALGFAPMKNTPVLLHDHDEYIHADVFLEGIQMYKKIIANLANV